MKSSFWIGVLLLLVVPGILPAQGPPIRTDKPIMLGARKSTLRVFYQYLRHGDNEYHIVPLGFDYNLRNNMELGIELPFAAVRTSTQRDGLRPGDMMLKAKYQFLRRDRMGSTFRVAAKAAGMFPTGRPSEALHVGMGAYQTYLGMLAGYESLQYGIVGELGYNALFSDIHPSYLESRLSFGLPLLKPVYPVRQVTLYFEYEGRWMPADNYKAIYIAQGVQYAFRSYVLEASLQVPLYEQVPHHFRRDLAFLIGGRFII